MLPFLRRTLVLSCTILIYAITSHCATIEDAFELGFGQALSNATAQGALLEHLDALVSICQCPPGKLLKIVHDYEDFAAKELGIAAVPQLQSEKQLAGWVDRVTSDLPKLDASHTFPLLRRCIVGALLRLWLQQGQRFPDSSSAKLQELLTQVGAARSGLGIANRWPAYTAHQWHVLLQPFLGH